MRIGRWREELTDEEFLAFYYGEGEAIDPPAIIRELRIAGLQECVIVKDEGDFMPGEATELEVLLDEGIIVRLAAYLVRRRPTS